MLDRSPAPVQSLDDIFVAPPVPITGRDAERIRTLVATGDVIPARNVDSGIRALGNDFLYPVAETAEVLRDADLALIDLEAPLIEHCPHHPGDGFQFCGQAGFVEALVHAGVDVASLENNHIGNYGPMGISETTALLHEHGIDHTDRRTLAVREVRGLRFGFLAFNGIGEAIDREEMVATIGQAAGQVDVLVVSFHWGREYTAVPQAAPGLAPDDPVEIAHLAIDAGADLLIGNHPHWIQAVELYNGKLIAYAHGNFIFDQAWSLRTRQGVVGRYTFYDDRLVRVEYLPVQIEGAGQPRFLDGDAAQAVLDRMYEASQSLAQQTQDGLRP
jgi:poly-gamma-glutamate synthesis protein (capsule biosynthesis protein)